MKQLKRNIAIVCGGDSSEHDVSLRSAQGLYSFFDKERYNVYIVDIKGQDWHVELPGGITAKIDRNDFSFIEDGKAKLFDYALLKMGKQNYLTMPILPYMVPLVRMVSCRVIWTWWIYLILPVAFWLRL